MSETSKREGRRPRRSLASLSYKEDEEEEQEYEEYEEYDDDNGYHSSNHRQGKKRSRDDEVISIDDDSTAMDEDDPVTTTATTSAVVLDTIPDLLFVKMLQENVNDVADSIDSLANMMTEEESAQAAKNIDESIALGAQGIIIIAMKKHYYDENVQTGGCDCLVNLLYQKGGTTTDVQWAIVKSGGLETIVAAMSNFPDSEMVQSKGLWALMNLFDDLDNAKGEVQVAAGRFITELNGCKLIVTAMQDFQDHSTLQEWGCGLCANLIATNATANPEVKEKMKSAGIVSAVGTTFQKHPDHKGVQTNANNFMSLMFTGKRTAKY